MQFQLRVLWWLRWMLPSFAENIEAWCWEGGCSWLYLVSCTNSINAYICSFNAITCYKCTCIKNGLTPSNRARFPATVVKRYANWKNKGMFPWVKLKSPAQVSCISIWTTGLDATVASIPRRWEYSGCISSLSRVTCSSAKCDERLTLIDPYSAGRWTSQTRSRLPSMSWGVAQSIKIEEQ